MTELSFSSRQHLSKCHTVNLITEIDSQSTKNHIFIQLLAGLLAYSIFRLSFPPFAGSGMGII